ncbi:hypothetical protein IFR05_006681 [Cadophora sp. M221]|nr:hypothetical protein IFR05_006681 [Cadophora sp. M221]
MSRLLRLPSCTHSPTVHSTVISNKARLSRALPLLLSSQTRTAHQPPLKLLATRPHSISLQRRTIQNYALQARKALDVADKIADVKPEFTKYKIQENPLGQLRPLRVIIFGAGVNGLNMLYTLRKETSGVDCVIFEKNPECGGTCPGCASDDPSHHYQYTHSLNTSWSSVFAQAGEIKQYLNDFIDKNDLRSSIHCNSSVTGAQWDDGKNKWIVAVKNEADERVSEEEADVIIDATGIFKLMVYRTSDYKWPELKGLESFKGRLIHTANWPSDFDYHGKNVAVLGNGASGVQIVPAIQPHVKKLVHCIRSKTWIAPPSKAVRYCHQHTISTTNLFSEEWMKTLASDPEKYKTFLKEIDNIAREERFRTDAWSEEKGGPRAYMSMMAEGMPNYFRPNGPLAHGAVPRLSTHMCTYVLSHIRKMQLENYSSIRPLPAAVRDFNEHIQAFMPRTAWAGRGCGGWYRSKSTKTRMGSSESEEGGLGGSMGSMGGMGGMGGGEERVTALHPGSQTHWEMMLERVRWEDFEYGRVGTGNRFAYLGNGFAVGEVSEEGTEGDGNGGEEK